MVLLEDDPAGIIRQCVSNFNTMPDRQAIARIHSTLNIMKQHRDQTLSSRASRLRSLQRQLTTIKQQHDLSVETHDPASHAENILRLDREKFRLAKEASDLEIESERLEGEVKSQEDVLRELERGGGRRKSEVAREEGAGLEALKLKLYRSLGVELDEKGAQAVVKGSHGVEVVDAGDVESLWRAV